MMSEKYKIIDDFQVKNFRVLVLDRDFNLGRRHSSLVSINGKSFPYQLNSIRKWVVIKATGSFKGMVASFDLNDPPKMVHCSTYRCGRGKRRGVQRIQLRNYHWRGQRRQDYSGYRRLPCGTECGRND